MQDGAGPAAPGCFLRLERAGSGAGPCDMESGELGTEGMETLTELGDELTLGDIDGERGAGRGRGARCRAARGLRGGAGEPPRRVLAGLSHARDVTASSMTSEGSGGRSGN